MQGHVEWNKHITLLLRIASEKKVPEWRFGQLIENLKRHIGTDDLFYIEDEMLAEEIIKYFDLDKEFRPAIVMDGSETYDAKALENI